MSDGGGLFLSRKRNRTRARPPPPNGSSSHAPSPSLAGNPLRAGSSSSAGPSPRPVNAGSPSTSSDPSKIVEFKLLSSGLENDIRYNVMRMNSVRDVDPRSITRPILMNRKEPGPKAPPAFATNEQGKIIGRYVYDKHGKPVLDANGEQVIEKRDEKDLALVGGAPNQPPKRAGRRGVKEVYHQDIEVIRLRREEHMPWIIESQTPKDEKEAGAMPEHWVGRITEPASMPSVLLVNDGTMGMGFKVVPLGRSYRFEPERPFKVLDADSANKLYEHQTKFRMHDRWAHREGGPSSGPSSEVSSLRSAAAVLAQEQRARALESRLTQRAGVAPKVKREKFEDDYKREGRMLERGLEGGADEELDYDFKEEFQDDEENNTFYQDREEEEEAKLQEEQLKKEFKLANANVGDRPQIEEDEDDDDDDLFGDGLNQEGKRLRKMMRKRGVMEDEFGTSESDDSDTETVKSQPTDQKEKDKEGEKEKDKDKETDRARSREPSAAPSDRSSRPQSRGPHSRGTSSPTSRRPQLPNPGKASTAPPGSGSALLAQRAAGGGVSPRHSRQTSPVGRGQSPVEGSRAGSPAAGSREASPTPSASGGSGRKPGQHPIGQPQKRKTPVASQSPGPSPGSSSNKRKPSPTTSAGGSADPSRKKKKSGSSTPTPGPEDQFPNIITREEVINWFRNGRKSIVPMSEAISAFKDRIKSAGERQGDNQKVFLSIVQSLTTAEPDRKLKLRDGVL
ncbi:hypothetical protein BD324DRAFT_683542 [Kockovaella imperatae]|uniref:Uncharacterized protein n=1 Tax=Kockovaella imperatae TaxID=4999 RepID=A0A1Y1U7W7_9TREE|nr:hypothetical protein BD324DRAFT_683542 [Kockovaella imperatae]ORX34102.1 hypothetical protein BD324DRAFT_683542 [Kockovaella imperatae]